MRYLPGLAATCALLLASAAAGQPTPDAHKRELARELMDTMHFDKMMDAMTSSMQQVMLSTFRSNISKADEPKLDAMTSATQEEMHAFLPKMETYMVDVYATELTEKELVDTVAFYKTESGQSVLAKMPALSQRMLPFVQQQMPIMLADMFHRYCSKITCTKEEKAQLAKMTGGH